jgi:hypothetical protein
VQVQARQHQHDGGYRARAEHSQEHPAQLDRGRLLAAGPAAHEQDHEHGHDQDLEDRADHQGVLVQRAIPPRVARRPAQPGQPRDDQQRQRQQPHQPVLHRERRFRVIAAFRALAAVRLLAAFARRLRDPRDPRRCSSRLAAGHRLTFLV